MGKENLTEKLFSYPQGAELIDVLDENGVFTGQITTRKEVHEKGLWHRAIIVALVNDDNKILIQRRAKTKEKFPGLWDLSVAGHVPAGQDSVSCAASEIMEEIGTILTKKVQIKDFRFMTSFRNQLSLSDRFIENQFYDFFVYNADITLTEFKAQKEEVDEIKYASAFEIKAMIDKGLFHPRNEWIQILYRYIMKF